MNAKQKEWAKSGNAARTHGMRSTKEYGVWNQMIQRCTNPNVRNYDRYGGRGIKVCERWMIFEFFILDMGRCPEGMTLERRDNDGDYEPSNCEWATPQKQAANRRRHTCRICGLPGNSRHHGV